MGNKINKRIMENAVKPMKGEKFHEIVKRIQENLKKRQEELKKKK